MRVSFPPVKQQNTNDEFCHKAILIPPHSNVGHSGKLCLMMSEYDLKPWRGSFELAYQNLCLRASLWY